MGIAAIQVTWPEWLEQTFFPSSQCGPTWNLADPVVSEKKMFENGGRQRSADGQMTEACLYYKLTHEPKGSGELNRDNPKWNLYVCNEKFFTVGNNQY